jgi:hypothetical protein
MVRSRQRGMTMWGTAFVVFVAVFFLFLLFKLLPVYVEDFKVRTALEGLAREPGAVAMSRSELVDRLHKRFVIDSVDEVDARQLRLGARGREKVLALRYEVVVPLAYNVSALLEFDHERPILQSQ